MSHCHDIEPRIIAEKVLRCADGSMPLDYKFMRFNGEPKLLFLDLGVAVAVPPVLGVAGCARPFRHGSGVVRTQLPISH